MEWLPLNQLRNYSGFNVLNFLQMLLQLNMSIILPLKTNKQTTPKVSVTQTIRNKIQSFHLKVTRSNLSAVSSTRKSFSWDAFIMVQHEIILSPLQLCSLLSLFQIGLANHVDGYGRLDFTCPNGQLRSPTILHDFPENTEKKFYGLWNGLVNLSLHGQLTSVKAPVSMQVTNEI